MTTKNEKIPPMHDTVVTIGQTGIFKQGGVRVEVTREAIESMLDRIAEGPAIPVIPNHDPFAMPIGKVKEAWGELQGNEYAIRARISVADVLPAGMQSSTGDALVRLHFDDPKPFVKAALGQVKQGQCTLSVDLANFNSMEDYTRFANDVRLIDPAIVCDNNIGRHSLSPDPFIQFVLANPELTVAIAWILWRVEKFARYTTDETLKKVGDDISDYLSSRIKKILPAYTNRSSEDSRPTAISIINLGEPEIRLLFKIERDGEFPALCPKKLVEELQKHRHVLKEAASITLARIGTDDWKFLYATTKSGMITGTRECYENTLKAMKSSGPEIEP